MKSSLGRLILTLSVSFTLLTGCSQASDTEQGKQPSEIMISAASSMSAVLTEVKAQIQAAHPDVRITYNFGGSGALQQQIEHGAPVDLFISAATEPMEKLAAKGLVRADEHTEWLSNQLVVIVPAGKGQKASSIEQLLELDRIAIGRPESVPAGRYAKEALRRSGLWNVLEDKLIYAKDVRQVLVLTETGNVDAGFVYKTDVLSSVKAETFLTIDNALSGEIHYSLGIISASKEQEAARLVYHYLQSPPAAELFAAHGFTTAGR